MATKKFLGCQYPIVKSPRGLMAQKYGVDQIKADLLQLLLTNPGERCMMPSYGTPLRKLIFEPNDPMLAVNAKSMITTAIATWEPRIEIKNIEVNYIMNRDDLNKEDPGYEADSILSIKILFYDPENINEIYDLYLETPVGN